MNIKITEVGARDGLQNEKGVVATPHKIHFINLLSQSGFQEIEATSFVRPGIIPQLSDARDVYTQIQKLPNIDYSALVPNLKGLVNALEAGAKTIAVFTAASDSFTKKNINCTIEESLERTREIFTNKPADVKVRGYVSTIVQCPYEGKINPEKVLYVTEKLLELGCYEVSLGETIGVAVPNEVAKLLEVLLKRLPKEKLAGHFHDTRGTALSNVFESIEFGISSFDSSAGGLGGCPYAPGAAGNLATEDLVYALERSGHSTGINLEKVFQASSFMSATLNRKVPSKVFQSLESLYANR